MGISYKKLWHLMLDKDMKKKDIIAAAKITDYTMRKLNNNEDVPVSVLAKISQVLECEIQDIIEILPDRSAEN